MSLLKLIIDIRDERKWLFWVARLHRNAGGVLPKVESSPESYGCLFQAGA